MTLQEAIDEIQYCIDNGLQIDWIPVKVLLLSVTSEPKPEDHYAKYYPINE